MNQYLTALLLMLTPIASTIGQGVETYSPRTVLRRPMPAITDPKLVEADQTEISDNELVIGVVIDGEARAYPINQLTGPRREIINDTLGGIAIAATW